MKKVAVLMSTYNGEKYIKQQIESVLLQTYEEITLIIRDDGSSDNTINIIKEAITENRTSKQIVLLKDNMGNLGYGGSFINLITSADGFEYYAFCDQDDYWLEDKIASAVVKLEQCENRGALYASNYWICNDRLEIKNSSAEHMELSELTLAQIFMEGRVAGFSLVFDNELREKAFFAKNIHHNIVTHDKWLSLVAVGLGQICIYDSVPRVYYRRHESTASPADQTIINRIRWRDNNVLKGTYLNDILAMIKVYRENYYDDIKNENDKTFLIKFSKDGIGGRISRAFYGKKLRKKFIDEIFLRLLLLTTSSQK